ncbi:DUF2189 domain-containing protein [Sinorhizobium sp. 7-81]|uniref:DUF2189 domain-containing protein n=1 Tax=Sinorhizobium sp. 8-89 TaxID=3049089 RepID=UPI0024C27605|nr:DUF2189 domain-containing protein [Sinorhizobium sp. 8-89]MDK1491267.1 DUF2189 domain-containing protein [Sinorhizobium sp. 8-89]
MAEKSRSFIGEVSGIEETWNPKWQRHLPAKAPFEWLAKGWRDLITYPIPSLAYGAGVFAVSFLIVWFLFATGRDYFLFPAMAGFMIVAPLLGAGLYLKSSRLEQAQPVSLGSMLRVRPAAGAQVLFTGMLLCMLMLLWMRAAVLIYALFFGVRPFPGLGHVTQLLLTTPAGWAMLLVGIFVGALFAGFSFAISVFSVPMLLDQRIDAFTAMGVSVALVWNNLRPMLVWGAIVLALFLVSVATALIGLIVIFPLLGHATWHAYKAMR